MTRDQRNQVSDLGEDALVERLTRDLPGHDDLLVGAGDDCAVIRSCADSTVWQLLKTDCIVEGVHFLPDDDPVAVGQKAMNRAVSDIAAMGGTPTHALVTIACDAGRSVDQLEAWYQGLKTAASACGCSVAGGETSRLPQPGAILSVAMTGQVAPAHCVLRSGAKVGDHILVTGRLGGSFASRRHLHFTPRLAEAAYLVRHFTPTAMMDLSDGLGSDLPRLARASGAGFQLDTSLLPLQDGVDTHAAIQDGEDYELLLTISPTRTDALLAAWAMQFPGTPLTVIGKITAETEQRSDLPGGWQHFQ